MTNTRLEITHVVENLERGGLERVVIDLVAAQREVGHQCRVICLFERGALAGELEAQGVEVLACSKRHGMDPGVLLRMRRLLRQQHGGVLHTHNAAAHYHAVLADIGLARQCVVNTRHGMGESDRASRRERLYRGSMRGTDVVVAVCEAARLRFEQQRLRPRSALVAVPNGLRVERFRATAPEARAALVAQLDLPTGTRLIGSVGRLNWAKDQANLIRAFSQLHAQQQDIALVLIGDGGLRDALAQAACDAGIAHRVRLLGDRNDVDELLRGLDIFALPSLTEGYSIALLEACAAALPIVATAVGGNAEIVRDGVNGRLVPAGDTPALAAALLALLQDPRRAEAMGQAGRDWVMSEGSFRTMASRYARVYAGLPPTPPLMP